nr:zinc finger protein 629-like isoform X2 [Aedes albopictus]
MYTTTEAEQSSNMNNSQVCRLCMSEEFLEDIFNHGELHTWIMELLSIKITQNDSISQSICAECKIRLNEFREYRLQCLDIQNVLWNERAVINDKQNSPEASALENPRNDDATPLPNSESEEKTNNVIAEETDQEVILVEDLSSSSECQEEDTRESNMSVDEHYPDDNDQVVEGPPTALSSIEILELSDDEGPKTKKLPSQKARRKETAKHTCEMCGKKVRGDQMEGHTNKHLGIKPYKCERGCSDVAFADNYHRIWHYRHRHDAPKYCCPVCNRSFATRQAIFRHKRKYHATKSYKCDICPKEFGSEYLQKKHMLEHGAKENKFSCPQCDAVFPTEYALLRHIPQKHVSSEGDDFGRNWLQAQLKQAKVKCEGEVMLPDAMLQDEFVTAEEDANHSDTGDLIVIQ